MIAIRATACDSDKPFGEIVIAVQTDVALPDSVDQIRIEARDGNNALKFGSNYDVGAGKATIPATLGMLQSENPAEIFTFRLIARKNGRAKMLREVTTSVPSRIASLRMPIRWLCDDSVKDPKDAAEVVPTCASDQTCIGGACYDRRISPNELDDFDNNASAYGACFDVVECMSRNATKVVPDPTTCTIDTPASGLTSLNIGLRVDNDGICDSAKQNCFVILEPTAKPSPTPIEGWRVEGSRIKLAPGVCNRITSGRVKEVLVSTGCPTKAIGGPVCGPWSGLQPPTNPPSTTDGGPEGGINPGGGIDAGPPGTIATIATGDTGDRVTNQCPVAFAGDYLFFCTQNPNVSSNVAQLRTIKLPLSAADPVKPGLSYGFPFSSFGGPFVTPDVLISYVMNVAVPGSQTFTSLDTKSLATNSVSVAFPEGIDDALPQPDAWDTTSLYIRGYSGKIYRAPRAGGSAVALLGTPTTNAAGPLIADRDPNGYVFATGGPEIERLSKVTAERIVLGTVPETGIYSMAITADRIFVSAATGRDAWIYWLPKTGGTPTKLFTGLAFVTPPMNLTVDGDYLYWSYSHQSPGYPTLIRGKLTGGVAPEAIDPFLRDPDGTTKIVGFAIRPDRIYYAADFQNGQNQIRVGAYTR